MCFIGRVQRWKLATQQGKMTEWHEFSHIHKFWSNSHSQQVSIINTKFYLRKMEAPLKRVQAIEEEIRSENYFNYVNGIKRKNFLSRHIKVIHRKSNLKWRESPREHNRFNWRFSVVSQNLVKSSKNLHFLDVCITRAIRN